MRKMLPKLLAVCFSLASIAGAACKEPYSETKPWASFVNGKIASIGVNGNGNVGITFSAYPGTGALPTTVGYLNPATTLFWIPAENVYRKDQLALIQQAYQLGSKVAVTYCTEANAGFGVSNELVNISIVP